jgi:hypothetical protein
MTWGAYGAQHPSEDSVRWRDLSEAVNRPNRINAGPGTLDSGNDGRPQQDSNLRSRLRRPLLSPLSYGGYATWDRVPAGGSLPDTRRVHCANTCARRYPHASGAGIETGARR